MKTLAILFTLLFVCGAACAGSPPPELPRIVVYESGNIYYDGVLIGNNSDVMYYQSASMEDMAAISDYSSSGWSVTSVSGKWSKHCCLCDNYLFKPMKDITAYELSLILELHWGKDIEDLTCEEFRSIKRHLKCND